MIRGVLFDMDGLMFDTERIGYEGWKYAGCKLGIDISDELIASFRGTGEKEKRRLFENAIGRAADYETAFSLRSDYAEEWIEKNGIPVKYGLENLLKYLENAGIKAIVATSSPQKKANSYLKKAHVYNYFETVVCGEQVEHAKPAPDIFLKGVKYLGVSPEECLVLEDSRNGLEAAKAAGCKAIVIPDMSPAPAQGEGLWDKKAVTLEEVITLLESMNR